MEVGDTGSPVGFSPEKVVLMLWGYGVNNLPVSSRMGCGRNTSERTVSVKMHWYTPASDELNIKVRTDSRLPLFPGSVLVGVVLIGTPSFSHVTVGGVKLLIVSSPTWPTWNSILANSPG